MRPEKRAAIERAQNLILKAECLVANDQVAAAHLKRALRRIKEELEIET